VINEKYSSDGIMDAWVGKRYNDKGRKLLGQM